MLGFRQFLLHSLGVLLRSLKPRRVKSLLLAAIVLAPAAAFADAIDGRWCSPEGKSLEIEGPRLLTPGGARIDGNYSRHAFTYVSPAGEEAGGSTIYMVLLGEETMEVRAGNPVGKPVTWKRCQTIS